VVLAFSHVLRDRLKATGRYNVLMTRDDDTFVELDARREFAEHHRASLFMAIHADYAGSSASGATIYTLRDRVASELQRSAAGEVAEHVLSDKELQAIKRIEVADTHAVRGFLADLAQREVAVTHERTNVFARSIIEYMGDATTMMDNPDRSAAFRVLKTAKVPSVLVELAYVTNKRDAANLRSDAWRRKVADSLVTAIDNYFTHQVARLPM
jgi:N-acetylmuramoyl-L-alanine amidase